MKTISPAVARWLEAKAMSEREFQKNVVEIAKAYGWLVAHFRPGMTSRVDKRGNPVWVTPMQGDPGFPDLVLSRPDPKAPRLILAELKVEGGKLTSAQETWKWSFGDAEHRDWEYYLWTPRMMAEIVEVLKP